MADKDKNELTATYKDPTGHRDADKYPEVKDPYNGRLPDNRAK